MKSFKENFIDLLEKREEIRLEIKEHQQKVRDLMDADKELIGEIEKVFIRMRENDPDLYHNLSETGSNNHIARFENNGELVEITLRSGYSNPVESIMIEKNRLML